MELFKQNDPRIMKTIFEYQKEKEESGVQEETKSNYIGETDTRCDEIIDYNFYYESDARHQDQ